MCLDDYRQLAKTLKTPPMFTDVLPMIVNQNEVELLLRLSEREQSIRQLSKLLGLSQKTLESKVNSLFVKGFLKKRAFRHNSTDTLHRTHHIPPRLLGLATSRRIADINAHKEARLAE